MFYAERFPSTSSYRVRIGRIFPLAANSGTAFSHGKGRGRKSTLIFNDVA